MSLSGNIIATLAYYDAFDQPLTAFEVWKHLTVEDVDGEKSEPVSLGDVVSALDGKDIRGRIAFWDGFFFLPGREHLVPLRIGTEKIAVAKLRRIRRLATALRLVPFVRMIGVTGSLAMKKGNSDSDWDFFVVLRAGRIWTGRTLLTGFLHLIGRRRHGNHTKDRACLNYFVTEDRLTIPTEDLFSANEYTFLIPLYGRETFQRFELKNRWIARLKPDFLPTEALPLWYVRDTDEARSFRTVLERIFDSDRLEAWLGEWQKKKILRNPKTGNEGGHIEASDQALVFLPDPHGPRVYEKFRKRLGEIRLRG
ncbi:MAG: hypothetical protein WCJ25_01600 [Candidatus Moraniibacteriota bacterium]